MRRREHRLQVTHTLSHSLRWCIRPSIKCFPVNHMKAINGIRGLLIKLALGVALLCASGCSPVAVSRSINGEHPAKNATEPKASEIERVGGIPDFRDCFTKHIDLQFVNRNVGWVYCSDDLWRTLDGGDSWEHIYSGTRENWPITFRFMDERVGWSVSANTLLKTEDGGRTWTTLTSPTPDSVNGDTLSVAFLKDGKRGWVVGGINLPITLSQLNMIRNGYSRGEGKSLAAITGAIFYTEDGGTSWRLQKVSKTLGSLIDGIYISDSEEVWAFGDAGIFYFAGGEWREVDYRRGTCAKKDLLIASGRDETAIKQGNGLDGAYLMQASPAVVYFANSKLGWLSFANGYIAKTVDGGLTWCDLLSPTFLRSHPHERNFLDRIYFSDEISGIGRSSVGSLYRTKDGGATWTKIDTNIKFDDIYFLDAKHIWGVAKEGLFRINPNG